MRNLPICEICGEEVDEVRQCRICGVMFCRNCGDFERDICQDCLMAGEGGFEGYEEDEEMDEFEEAWYGDEEEEDW